MSVPLYQRPVWTPPSANSAIEGDPMFATNTPHDFDFQMRIWGWSVWDNEDVRNGLRNPALTFERDELDESRWWDRTLHAFDDVQVWHGDKRVEVPPWWALCASLYMIEVP